LKYVKDLQARVKYLEGLLTTHGLSDLIDGTGNYLPEDQENAADLDNSDLIDQTDRLLVRVVLWPRAHEGPLTSILTAG
jgi:hypothetical protein